MAKARNQKQARPSPSNPTGPTPQLHYCGHVPATICKCHFPATKLSAVHTMGATLPAVYKYSFVSAKRRPGIFPQAHQCTGSVTGTSNSQRDASPTSIIFNRSQWRVACLQPLHSLPGLFEQSGDSSFWRWLFSCRHFSQRFPSRKLEISEKALISFIAHLYFKNYFFPLYLLMLC